MSGLSFCDSCIKKDITSSITQESVQEINKLKADLKSLKNREDATISEISNKAQIVSGLESKIKENTNIHLSNMEDLHEKLGCVMGDIMTNEEESLKLQQEIEKCEHNIQRLTQCYVTIKCEIPKVSRVNDSINKEVSELNQEVEELMKKCNNSIPYSRIRNIDCIKCHENLKTNMREYIIRVLEHVKKKQYLLSFFSQNNKNSQKSPTCSACLIF